MAEEKVEPGSRIPAPLAELTAESLEVLVAFAGEEKDVKTIMPGLLVDDGERVTVTDGVTYGHVLQTYECLEGHYLPAIAQSEDPMAQSIFDLYNELKARCEEVQAAKEADRNI